MQVVYASYLNNGRAPARIDVVNQIQKKLLELSDTVDLSSKTYYRLSKELGVDHPYKVKFALDQLIKKGYLIKNNSTGSIRKSSQRFSGLISIPFYGEVNCGQPLQLASDDVIDFLRVSPSTIASTKYDKLFALKATGWSMNRSNINGKSVSDGDYIICERTEPHMISNGDYVISIIGGAANLKRFKKDDLNKRVILFSESSYDFPPIFISSQDADRIEEYLPIAKAIEVVPGI